jgi:lipopolysaccharide transport system ATP-binding protein
LLEVGTGFHPELTGRENISLNGAILGMTRSDIAARFDEIVQFAEVEKFIDTPVKRYSSGMYLRLAFAVAAHLEPDVLIVDEVLSVGDAAFQTKCLGRMERVAGEGRTVLFVSHNLTAVQQLCSRSMLLAGGEVVTEGRTDEVVRRYLAGLSSGEDETPLHDRVDREGSGRIRFTSIAYESGGERTDTPVTGRELEIIVNYETANGEPVREPVFSIAVYTLLGGLILQLQSNVAGARFREVAGRGQIRVRLPRLPLPAGRYTLNLFVYAGNEIADWLQRATDLTVAEGDYFMSGERLPESHQSVLVDQDWRVSTES